MAIITHDIQNLIIFVLILLISVRFLQYILMLKKPSKQTTHLRLPPSPPALPIIGHIHYLNTVVYKGFHKLSSKYGPLLYLRLGSFPLLLVSSASMAMAIFKTNDLNFAARPESPFEENLVFGASGFVTAPYGHYWRFMKKLCVTELLGARQMERSGNVRREEIVRFLHKILEKAHKMEAINVVAETTKLTNNSICRMVMSTRCSEEDNEAERCRELVNQSFVQAAKMTLAHLLGPFKKLVIWAFGKQVLEVPRRCDELLEKFLKEHEETRVKRDGSGEREHKDLMDILLEVYHDENAEVKIDRVHIKAFILDLFIGGTSTSADAMQWIMAELINHPDVFKKLREEIESVVGRNRLVEESDIQSLPYLQVVVKETLRLHPPGPVIARECRESCEIGGFDVPKGTPVAINVYSILRDPEIWDNPDQFFPERFLVSSQGQDNQKENRGHNFNFIPFGGGRRMCPGGNLALCLINTTIAAMVQCFDWKFGEDQDGAKVNMQVKSGLMMNMAHPLLSFPVVHFNPFKA